MQPTDATATDFVPPCPMRPDRPLTAWDVLALARKDFLSLWAPGDFATRFRVVTIFRRRILIVNSPKLVQEAFHTNHTIFQRKSPQMRHALKPLIGDGLFISDHEVWARRRRIVGPIIHTARVPGFVPVMIRAIEEKRDEWLAQGDGAQIDALADMARLTAEIICRTIFGQELGRHHADEIVAGFSDYQARIDQFDLFTALGLPDWLPRFRNRGVRKATARVLRALDAIIAGIASTGVKDDASVIGGLLSARDEDGTPLGPDAIRNEAAVIFMAGHETTANTLAWAWYLLSQSPRVADRLRAEVDEVLADCAPTFADVHRLPYTRAVIEETLRLYPPVPILAREASGDGMILDQPISKGTLLLVVPWMLHRSPNFWPDAAAFRPERHMEAKSPSKYLYIPFSIGPRVCPGQVFGMTEAILSLAILARRVTLDLVPGTDVQPVCRLTLRPGDTLPMILRLRDVA
ncbi:MAG: cytochrome P450 [Pseudomonadota bacterium]